MTEWDISLVLSVLITIGIFRFGKRNETFPLKLLMGLLKVLSVSATIIIADGWRLENHIGNGGYYGFPVLGILIALTLMSVWILYAMGAAIAYLIRRRSKH